MRGIEGPTEQSDASRHPPQANAPSQDPLAAVVVARPLAQPLYAWYTHLMSTSTTSARAAADPTLADLDDALFDLQRLVRRPGYRAQLLERLGSHVEFSTVRVLRAVERAGPEPPCIGDVADRLQVDPSTASRFVEQQVDAGYLQRERHPDDRRRSQLVLTPAGRDLLEQVNTARRDLLAEVTATWETTDLRRLADLLAQLRHGFDDLEGDA